jgi:hypothetical protein
MRGRIDAQSRLAPFRDCRSRLLPEGVQQRRGDDQGQHGQAEPSVQGVVASPLQFEVERAIERFRAVLHATAQ